MHSRRERSLCGTWDEKNYPSDLINLSSVSDFQQQQSAVPAAERDDINGS